MSGLIGQQIGQYQIIALLGKGGMATVYRAHQESMGRDVAIKVIKPDLVEVGDFIKRFQREVRTVASLSHPHILKVFDYGQHGDLVFLVMELLRGGSLAEQIRRGALSTQRALAILEQIGSALDHAHRLGIIHRDLKPQNVMLDEDGNAFLTDFGIAKILSETTVLTQTGAAMGTPAYMPPEQWQGLPLDARADIYSLGVMLYEMLTGKLPFSGDTPFHMMHLHVSEPPPPIRRERADLPPAVEAVISKALAKNREERFASASDLTSAFRAALAGQVPTNTSPPPLAPDSATFVEIAPNTATAPRGAVTVPSSSSTGRGWIISGVAAIVVLALVGLFILTRQTPPSVGSILTVSPTPQATTVALGSSPTAGSPSPTIAASATVVTEATTIAVVSTSASATTLPTTTVPSVPSAVSSAVPPSLTPTTAPSQTLQSLPSPTVAPSTTPTVTVTETATATPSITWTPSPNVATRAAATFGARATATANAVASFTATSTPNDEATLQAVVGATETALATLATLPTSTSTASVTASPTASATPTVLPPTSAATSTQTSTPTPKITQPTGRIAFASKRGARYQLYTVDANGEHETRISSGNGDDFGASWATDGIRIAFTSNRNGANKIYIMNVGDPGSARQLTTGPGDDYAPAWSPDGLRIVYHNNREGNWELYVINTDGSNTRRLTNNPADDTDATWSPDGTSIAFHSTRDKTNAIWVMQADGTNPRKLSPANVDAHDPAWSPNGQYIAFTSFTNKKPSLYLMNADGTNVHPLLNNPGEDDQAAWSPDSQYIVFRNKSGNQVSVALVDINGTSIRRLTTQGADNQFPTWQGSATGG